ncbi:MAG: transporter, partial [Rhizorhabdus sp.]|nr:transporter [Rhizorhabdus sp.]
MAAPFAAAIGCLQPGIDPVFLMLLSNASEVPPAAHGMIVGGTQAGAAIGSLIIWRLGTSLPHAALIGMAGIALGCSLATPLADSFAAVLALRCCYGLAMGMVYAYAMAAYAAKRPNKAYGAVFLIQLILSTLVSIGLPELELALGQQAALGMLAIAPASALAALLMLGAKDGPGADAAIIVESRAVVPVAGWALAAATFWFICSTMLVWSSAAALATSAGIASRTIGHAVAIGSIVGALTAVAVMRDKLLFPLPVTALLSAVALASPILLTAPGEDVAFVVSIILLNIGSTAIIIRCSGLATATSTDSRFRIFVACSHSLGLIAGPLLGSVMMALLGPAGLLFGAMIALPAGLGTVIWGVRAGS